MFLLSTFISSALWDIHLISGLGIVLFEVETVVALVGFSICHSTACGLARNTEDSNLVR